MNTVLEILKYFETAPLEDAKYASAFLRRLIVGRASEAAAKQKRKRARGWKSPVYGPGALRREQSVAARVEKVLDSAQCEMTTREIRDALAEDGDALTMEALRPALAREVRRDGARIVRVRDGVYFAKGVEPPEGAGSR